MAREELALQTQLLLQEASHLSQGATAADVEASALVEGDAPAVSELESARQTLLDKLKRKKEQRRAQMQQLNQQRYGFGGANTAAAASSPAGGPRLTPVKAKAAFKPPVAATASATVHKKQDLIQRLRAQAIQQGAQNMAKLFGYKSYEAQIEKLNQLEAEKILESEQRERGAKEAEEAQTRSQAVSEEDGNEEEEETAMDDADNGPESMMQDVDAESTSASGVDRTAAPTSPHDASTATLIAGTAVVDAAEPIAASERAPVRIKRRNRIDEAEDDGNEADSEQDGDDNDEPMEVADDADASARPFVDGAASGGAADPPLSSSAPVKDRAAAYRELLKAEALATRRRKRLVRGGGGGNFVESEAEEDEEEDALKIGGLGDFGFGVPQAKTQESKEAEEERKALQLREDDLEGIVDDLSDDEQAQQQDLDEIFRNETEAQDREQVKEVMRNVKEGFGRNRRAFSAGFQSGAARGRFNLDELVAADGSKFEAARLGLLESDEEWSGDEAGAKKKLRQSRRTGRAQEGEGDEDGEEDEEGDEEEEDEEAEMERLLRERFQSQPKIYVTSSESESEEEEEDAKGADGKGAADADEANSDEEREKQQMKLFSERARVNRRMARMKDLQRQLSLEAGAGKDAGEQAAMSALPNLLLEDDEDSQELMKLLNRTDKPSASAAASDERKRATATIARARPMLGRFNSFGGASSFHRAAGSCTMFNAGSSLSGQASKGFVFTALASERPEEGDAAASGEQELLPPMARPQLGKSKSWGQPGRRPGKRGADGGATANGPSKKPKRTSAFFSVLSSYQVVARSSNQSAPL